MVIDATTGELIRNVSAAHALVSAQTFASSHGSALAASAAPQHLGMVGEDAFTHSRALDMHRPLHTVALGDADDTVVYVSNATGEVVRDATRTERLWNYAGAWIHWLYPFRGNMFDRYWTDIVNWLSIAGVVLALTGTVVGVLRWRFTGPRYKSGSRSPYPGGMMKWHHTTGLLFAAVTITWVFSGLMSMNPWKLFDSGAPPLRTAAMHGGPLQLANGAPLASVQALLAQATPNVRELRWVRAAGHTVVQAWSPSGVATLLDATTAAHHAIAPRELTAAAARLVDAPVQEVQTLNAYDLHYYDRAPHTMGGGADKPLPVWRVVFADPHATWVHIDPRTGTVLGRTDTHRRTSRWLFSMLHSWDWLPLLERRPLWDVVLIVLSLGGTALSVTGVVVGWRRLRVKARSGAKAAHPRTARAAAASAPTGRASPQAGNV